MAKCFRTFRMTVSSYWRPQTWYSEMVLIRLEFSSSIFWMVAELAGGLAGPPGPGGPFVAGGPPAAGPLGPGGPPGLGPPGAWEAGGPSGGAGLEEGGGAEEEEAGGPGGAGPGAAELAIATPDILGWWDSETWGDVTRGARGRFLN